MLARRREIEIEAVYHGLTADPEKGPDRFERLARDYLAGLDYAALNKLLMTVTELKTFGLLSGDAEDRLAKVRNLADLDAPATRWAIKGTKRALTQEAEADRRPQVWDAALLKLPAPGELPPDAAEAAQAAHQALRAGRIDEAAGLLDSLVDRIDADESVGPTARVDLFTLRGHAHLAAGRYAQAAEDFDRAHVIANQQGRSRIGPLLGRSEAHLALGRYRMALRDAADALRIDGGSVRARILRGEAYLKMGHLGAAESDFKEALGIGGTKYASARALGGLGETYRRQGEFDRAIQAFEQGIHLRPDNGWMQAGLGETYRQRASSKCDRAPRGDGRALGSCSDDFVAGIEALDRAIALDPQDAWSLASRGESYRQLAGVTDLLEGPQNAGISERYLEQAIKDLDRAIALRDDYPWARLCRGHLRKRLKDYDAALVDYQALVDQRPDNALFLAARGDLYRLTGRFRKARADLDEALSRDPGNAWTLGRRGYVRLSLGRYQEAIEDFERALAINPREWYLLYRAEAALQRARLDPGMDDSARRTLLAGAEESLSRLLDREPPLPDDDLPEIRLVRARILETLGRFVLAEAPEDGIARIRQARKELQATRAESAADGGFDLVCLEHQRLFYLGRVQVVLGELAEAAESFRQALGAWQPRPAEDAERLSQLGEHLWHARLLYATGSTEPAFDTLKAAPARWVDQEPEYCAAAARQSALDLLELERSGPADPERLRRLQEILDRPLSPMPEPGTPSPG